MRSTWKKGLTNKIFIIVLLAVFIIGDKAQAATVLGSGTSGNLEWSVDADGCFHLSGSGDYKIYGSGLPYWYKYLDEIKSADINVKNITSLRKLFDGCKNLEYVNWNGIDTSKVTDMSCMFTKCENLESIDLSSFDTSSVTDMGMMFYGCKRIKKLKITSFDTSNVTYMSNMFEGCESLAALELNNFDTSNVTYMHGMFKDCYNLKTINLDNFNTSKVKDMGSMFEMSSHVWDFEEVTPKLTNLDLSNFNTSQVEDMGRMFFGCGKLTDLNISSFNTDQVTDMNYMFAWCRNLKLNIDHLDTSNVTDMSGFFAGCSLNNINLSHLNTSNVTNMSGMFRECDLTGIDFKSLDTSKVTHMGWMFECCKGEDLDLSNFDTSQVTIIDGMFKECSNLKSLDISGFDLSSLESAEDVLYESCSLDSIRVPLKLNLNIELPEQCSCDWEWENEKGEISNCLPKNLSTSFWLYRDEMGTADKDETITTPEKLYDTSTEGVCSENHIANLLGKSDYRYYTGCICSREMVIPGIKQTNMGNNTVCKDMVTQGICVTNDYVLISAYCHDKAHNSVIYVMDKQTKEYLTTILLSVEDNAGLKKGNHVGGLAYGDGIIFIAGSDDNKVWKLPIEAVDYAVVSGKDTYTATISKNKYINTTKASYIYWDNCFRELFVGHFDKNEKNANENYMISYDVNTGHPTSSKIQLPLQTQGVSFGVGSDNKTYCICSKSYGRGNVSQIYVAEMKKIKGKAGYELTNWHKITAPNMSEDIQVWNGILYNCFESAANYYNGEALRTTAFDRIPYINTRALISTVMTKGERAKREEILRYRMMSRTESGTEADQIITEGACGANVNYCLYKDGSMVVSGQGSMEDYVEDNVPWGKYKGEIISVYVDSGVDGIGAYAFSDCNNLEKVTISEYRNADVNFMIGNYAFKNCLQLNKVELPDASYSIEDTAFDEKSEIQICSDAASIVKYCNQYDNLSLHKHHMEYKNTVQPTCLEIGYDSYVCDCGYEEIANVVEATKVHTFKEVERVEAAQDEEGYIKYQCTGCSDTYYEVLEYKQQESTTSENTEEKITNTTQKEENTEEKTTSTTQKEKSTLSLIGTKVTLSNGIYKITKSTSTKKEVSFIKPKSSKKLWVSIPDTIKISGFTYKVTSVAANALANNKKVTKVTVGKNVTSIGKNAFKKCTKLKTVTLKSTFLKSIGSKAFYGDKNLKTITIKSSKLTSKSVGKNAFKGTNKKLTIKVPKKKVSSYKKFLKKKGNKKITVKKG